MGGDVMELLSLAAVVLVACAAFLTLDRRDKREREERRQLLNRIQSPDLAALENLDFEDENGELLSIEYDNDEAHAALRDDERASAQS